MTAKLAGVGHTGKVAFGIALANQVRWLAGNDKEMPWLGVHERGCAGGQRDDLFDHVSRYGFVL